MKKTKYIFNFLEKKKLTVLNIAHLIHICRLLNAASFESHDGVGALFKHLDTSRRILPHSSSYTSVCNGKEFREKNEVEINMNGEGEGIERLKFWQ